MASVSGKGIGMEGGKQGSLLCVTHTAQIKCSYHFHNIIIHAIVIHGKANASMCWANNIEAFIYK